MQEYAYKQDMRLMRLGIFDSQLPSQDALEKAYTFYKKDVRKSSHSSDDKEWQLKILKSAFKNIAKTLHDRTPSPSTDAERVAR